MGKRSVVDMSEEGREVFNRLVRSIYGGDQRSLTRQL
jgi:hypothetical protein